MRRGKWCELWLEGQNAVIPGICMFGYSFQREIVLESEILKGALKYNQFVEALRNLVKLNLVFRCGKLDNEMWIFSSRLVSRVHTGLCTVLVNITTYESHGLEFES